MIVERKKVNANARKLLRNVALAIKKNPSVLVRILSRLGILLPHLSRVLVILLYVLIKQS